MPKYTFSTIGKHYFTDEDISNLLCGAIEGGSNYWYMIYSKIEGEYACDEWKNGKGLLVGDTQDMTRPKVWVNRQSIADALQLFRDKAKRHYNDFLSDNFDAITGDVFLQFIVFKEHLYG